MTRDDLVDVIGLTALVASTVITLWLPALLAG